MSVYAIGEHHLIEEELARKTFDFDLEDVLYIRLDPLEAKLRQLQDRRILDNQYLFSVNPAGRRWYELMAAKNNGYSDLYKERVCHDWSDEHKRWVTLRSKLSSYSACRHDCRARTSVRRFRIPIPSWLPGSVSATVWS